MTDKQIIIDGVDVSKCKYFDCDSKKCKAEYYVRHGYEIVEYDSCRENPNCYYKQLKRKEQECEELKEAIDRLLKIQYQLADSCNKYVQTLTEIKEIVEGMHDLWNNKTPYTDMDNLVKHLLECELNRIRYKLDEISECEVKNENIRNL